MLVVLTISCKKYDYVCTIRPRVITSNTTSHEYIEQRRMTLKQAQKYQAKKSDKDNVAYCQIYYK